MRRRQLGGVLVALVLGGCGLPMPSGVQQPGRVPAEQRNPGDISVLPPGPRADATPEEVVTDFLAAQSNPEESHAIARRFLSRGVPWDDAAQVQVFDPTTLVKATDAKNPSVVRVTARLVGRIRRDGSYDPTRGTISEVFRLGQDARRRWSLTAIPPGLLLSPADRDRSFRVRSVYYLAPSSGETSLSAHLVPDQVFFPVSADAAGALVSRLLAGPSADLASAVQTAVPAGVRLAAPVTTSGAGVVTVDLGPQLRRLGEAQLARLSAQLVWTLRGAGAAFARLRLRSAGHAVLVDTGSGARDIQDRTSWQTFDPDGLAPSASGFYVSARRLRSLETGGAVGPPPGEARSVPVDVAAVSTTGRQLALLTRVGTTWQLKTGPVAGPFSPRRTGRQLASPSWGSGEPGLWVLDGDRVLLLTNAGPVRDVEVPGLSAHGSPRVLRVSRDGARVALVAGTGVGRRLLVGRIETADGHTRIAGLRDVAPAVTDVGDVSWSSATSLVVIGRYGSLAPLPVSVAVDGSAVGLVTRFGLESSSPQTVAAAPDRPLLIGALVAGRPVVFRDDGHFYSRQGNGSAPFYPG